MSEAAVPAGVQVTVSYGGKTVTVDHRPDQSILQTARWAGLRPPSQCESGTCGTCMARVTDGAAEMRNNEVLDDDDLEEGWVLTCQAVPATSEVTVVYE